MAASLRPDVYHPSSMRRAGGALLLAILVGALPTVVSLCEFRCTARPVAASHADPPPCHETGHPGKAAPRSTPDGHDDCARHVLLARGNAPGIDVQIDRALLAVVLPLDSFRVSPDQRLENEKLASADLSPPFGRSSDILRL